MNVPNNKKNHIPFGFFLCSFNITVLAGFFVLIFRRLSGGRRRFLRAISDLYDLSHDGERNLFWKSSANIQPDGGVQARQDIFIQTRLSQAGSTVLVGALAANGSDITSLAGEHDQQGGVIQFGIMR
jgi:hypothetical protein